jgi:hypothetical protein
MSAADIDKVKRINFLRYSFYLERWDPKEWFVDRERDISLIYVSSTDGTHAPEDFIETITFLLLWKEKPVLITMADKWKELWKSGIRTYTVLYMKNMKGLDVEIGGIESILKEALTIYRQGPVEICF